jgi:general secretion pathway protein D
VKSSFGSMAAPRWMTASIASLLLAISALGVSDAAFAGDPETNGSDEPKRPPLKPGPKAPGGGDKGGPDAGGDSGDKSGDKGGDKSGDKGGEDGAGPEKVDLGADPDRQKPPTLGGAKKITLDFQDKTLRMLAKYFAELMGQNLILGEEKELGEKVSIISYKPVSVADGYQAFLQALDRYGYTPITIGQNVQIIKVGEAASNPLGIGQGGDIKSTSQWVTQIIPLENVSVNDMQSVVSTLKSKDANLITYPASNMFILTDTAVNIKRVYKIISDLDVAAPKSRLEIVPISYAKASDLKTMIEQLYGTASTASSAAAPAAPAAGAGRPRRARAAEAEAAAAPTGGDVTAGKESSYISKVLNDERTNSLIVLANEEGQKAVSDLVAKLDVDTENRGAQIYVVYLEHAKATEVSQVLQNLAQSSAQKTTGAAGTPRRPVPANPNARAPGAATPPSPAPGTPGADDDGNASAAFDSGMRIAPDENTNALVIIATPDEFKVMKQVIDQLDIRRRQVMIDAVILELASTDEFELGIGYHAPTQPSADTTGLLGGSFGTSSVTGLTQDLLSGLAVGVFGPSVSVPVTGPDGSATTLAIPAFGIVINALRTNAASDIVSVPNITTLDNQEAKIVVGRKVPFPTSSSFSQTGLPIVSYQREDVATTLKVTPRVNSSNEVTLDVTVEVAEVEQDNSGLNVNTAGFITSKREVDTTILVGDNHTVVLGGLIGTTNSRVETKVPVLGDLPLIGMLFRGSRTEYRKSNLMIFLTPHIIDDETDILDIMRVKEAQRQEFIRRFYGKSRDKQMKELNDLLSYSLNFPDQPSKYPQRETQKSSTIEVGKPTLKPTGTVGPQLDTAPDGVPEASDKPVAPEGN